MLFQNYEQKQCISYHFLTEDSSLTADTSEEHCYMKCRTMIDSKAVEKAPENTDHKVNSIETYE